MKIKGGKHVKIEAFVASLYQTPWMIEEEWLQTMVTMTADCDPSAFVEKTPIPGTDAATFKDGIATIPISGPIFAKPNFLTEWLGIGTVSSRVSEDLAKALSMDEVSSVILDIDSPGGVVTGTNQLAAEIKAANDIKPITAYIGGTGASAAYWLASGAGEIVVDATARIGSIGVVAAVPIHSDDDDYVEIVNSSSPDKRPDVTTEEGKNVIVKELDALADVFISTVAAHRGVSVSTVKNDFGKGGCLVGQGAVDVGMVDRVGSMNSIYEKFETEGETSMDKATLKAKFPDLYAEIYGEGVASVDTSDTTAAEDTIAAKDKEIADLKASLKDAQNANDTLGDRVKALEKSESMRAEKDIKNTADGIMDAKLAASSVPKRVHGKVRAQVDYNQFVTDGKFDQKAYGEAVDAEVADWENLFSQDNDFIQSIPTGSHSRQVTDDDDAAADDTIVDRLLAYGNPDKKEA